MLNVRILYLNHVPFLFFIGKMFPLKCCILLFIVKICTNIGRVAVCTVEMY